MFGDAPAASFSMVDDATITAVSPDHAEGTVDVTVTTAGGATNISNGDHFTYGACTSATASVAPPSPSIAGTLVTITGAGAGCTTPLYEFWLQWIDGTWHMVKAFGDATWGWDTSAYAPGTYTIHVWANNTGDSQAAFEVFGTSTYTVLPNVGTSVAGANQSQRARRNHRHAYRLIVGLHESPVRVLGHVSQPDLASHPGLRRVDVQLEHRWARPGNLRGARVGQPAGRVDQSVSGDRSDHGHADRMLIGDGQSAIRFGHRRHPGDIHRNADWLSKPGLRALVAVSGRNLAHDARVLLEQCLDVGDDGLSQRHIRASFLGQQPGLVLRRFPDLRHVDLHGDLNSNSRRFDQFSAVERWLLTKQDSTLS